MEQPLSSFRAAFPQIGVDPGDSQDVRLEKRVLLIGSVLVVIAATIWGALFFIYGERLAGALSIGYAGLTLVGLVIFHRTHRHRALLASQLILGLTVPFLHTWILGGFWSSGGVILWSLISPLGALAFYETRRAQWWWLTFFAILALTAGIHPSLQASNLLPPRLVTALFAMNMGGVSGIVLLTLHYFIQEKDTAYRQLREEEAKTESLLLNILPEEIAAKLRDDRQAIADSFEHTSILFADLVRFTELTAQMAPTDVVRLLNEIFSYFDSLVEQYGVEKIRTIGDNYMVAAGAPRPMPDHAQRLARMALDMRAYLQDKHAPNGEPVQFRIGINSGPVIGGVIGHKKFVYDVWGDAVNIASRMESHGVPGKIQVTETTRELLAGDFSLQNRGTIEVKGRGKMNTWFLEGPLE